MKLTSRPVGISRGNSKMGEIASVSLPAGVTCRLCTCIEKCYAKRMENRWKNVFESYANNHSIYVHEPERYWREVEAAIMMSRYFRFHVSGDIPDQVYFKNMVEIAARNSHCEILCFTKQYHFVNHYLENNTELPQNLHVIFSGWPDLVMENPHHLPEAHVRFRDGSTIAREDAKPCGGNCTECAKTDCGCWTLQKGEQVIFNEH